MLRKIFFLFAFLPLFAQDDESACWNEPGLSYEYYDYANTCQPQQTCCRRFENDAQYGRECCIRGIWFPEAPTLFEPLAADPREISYSLAWRNHDRALKENNVVAVSYGDTFPVYRWFNVWPCRGGELQIDIQGALYGVFAPCEEDKPLINTDYYVGVPITYARGCWSYRLRGYHISCHIGDEFLLLNPGFDRRNPSAEFLDFFVSYDRTCNLRLYGGIGVSVTQDSSFKCGRGFIEAGAEVRVQALKFISYKNRYSGVPIFAMHFTYQHKLNEHINNTYILGYEWAKRSGLQHKVRVYMEYHDGYSFEGQFCMRPTKYFAIKTSYSL